MDPMGDDGHRGPVATNATARRRSGSLPTPPPRPESARRGAPTAPARTLRMGHTVNTRLSRKSADLRQLPRRDRRATLAVEGMEKRLVQTVVFRPHFGAETVTMAPGHSGMKSPDVFVVFQGHYWTTSQ